jgi:hypothetical protein
MLLLKAAFTGERTFLGDVPLRDQVAQPHSSTLLAAHHIRALCILHCGHMLPICMQFDKGHAQPLHTTYDPICV